MQGRNGHTRVFVCEVVVGFSSHCFFLDRSIMGVWKLGNRSDV